MSPLSSQWSLLFLLPFAATLIVGAGNYMLVRLAYDHVPDFVEAVSFPCALILFLFVVPLIVLLPPLLVVVVLGLFAARADQAISNENDTLTWHYWRLCVAVVVSLVDALLIFVLVGLVAANRSIPLAITFDSVWLPVCLMGFIIGPVVAPLWIWGYRSLNAFFSRRSP